MVWRDWFGDFGRAAFAERGAGLVRCRCEWSPVDAGGLLKRDILAATEAVGRAGAV